MSDENLAQDIYNKLKAGEDFAELAKTHSTGEAADNGGLIPFIPIPRVNPRIVEELKKINKDEVADF